MTGVFTLDWAILALSLFNTILMLWLGLTVLLNTERRTWGAWLIGVSLLFSGVFFISHTAIAGQGLHVSPEVDVWWQAGLWAVVLLPFAWYVVMLWYTGFWEDRASPLHQRQRPFLLVTAGMAITMMALLIVANPLPTFSRVTQLDLSVTPSLGGIPLLIVAYPAFIVLCLSFALDALLRPGPSARLMGDLARRRARPWLLGATVLLLVVSLLVAWAMLWVNVQRALTSDLLVTLGWFDLAISALIAGVVLLLGQAIIAHEVFTGRALPRQGLLRYWRRAVILAAGYGVVVGASLAAQLRPIYGLLLTTLLMTIFYALVTWRAYAERERYTRELRPFVASQRLYDHLVSADESRDSSARPFAALCENVLNARRAFLIPHGPLAPLAGSPLNYPDDAIAPTAIHEITARCESPQVTILPIDSAQYGGALWAAPLWSERGLIGLLLLGEKNDGGLYTDEEIEIARATGERLIDAQASAELTRRLMALQRQRLAESQLLDRRARHVLHDDILPRLHTALLSLSNDREAVTLLSEAHRRISDLLREMPAAPAPELTRLGLFGALTHTATQELANAFDEVSWEVSPEAERRAQTLAPLTAEAIFAAAREAIRNAARHGRSGHDHRPLHLRVSAEGRDGLSITIEDNGVGIGDAASRGNGQGLALHSAMMAVVGGALTVESQPGVFTRVRLTLPG